MRQILRAVTAVANLWLAAGSASAADLGSLSAMLVQPFTAMNLARVCATLPGWGTTQPRGGRGGAIDYAFHVKAEVIDGLRSDETNRVLRNAADKAREESRRQLYTHVRPQQEQAYLLRLTRWCDQDVAPFIAQVINDHDRNHSAFYEQLTHAKSVEGL